MPKPKYRKLYTRVLSSPEFVGLPDDFARLAWVLLPLISCREGRGRADGDWAAAQLFPNGGRDGARVQQALEAIAAAGLIRRYLVDGQAYYQIINWHKYQSTGRERRSPFPAPPKGQPLIDVLGGSGATSQASSPAPTADASDDSILDEPAVAAVLAAFESRALFAPHWTTPNFQEDWVLPARAWAAAFPEADLKTETQGALDFAAAKGYTIRSPRSLRTIMANRLQQRRLDTAAPPANGTGPYSGLSYDAEL